MLEGKYMNYTRPFITGFFSIAAIILLSAPPSFCADAEIKVLQEKVNALEKKVNQLEHNFNQRFMAIEKKTHQAQKPNIALENTANKELKNIKALVSNEQITLAKAKLADFFKKYSSTRVASSARKLSQEISIIGMDVPKNWDIETWLQGKDEINLEKQSTMLLFFWETWCGYCRREAPKIQKIYTDYKDKGLKVIGLTKINKTATPEKVVEFIKEKGITYPIAKETGTLSQYFKVRGIPAAALISNGKIVWRGHPGRLPDQLLKKYLKSQIRPQSDQDKDTITPEF